MTQNNSLTSVQNKHLITLIAKAGEAIQSTTRIFSKDDLSGTLSISKFEEIQSLTRELQRLLAVCKTMESDLDYENSNPDIRLKNAVKKFQSSELSAKGVLDHILVQAGNLVQAATRLLQYGASHYHTDLPAGVNCRKYLAETISEMMGLLTACGIKSDMDNDSEK